MQKAKTFIYDTSNNWNIDNTRLPDIRASPASQEEYLENLKLDCNFKWHPKNFIKDADQYCISFADSKVLQRLKVALIHLFGKKHTMQAPESGSRGERALQRCLLKAFPCVREDSRQALETMLKQKENLCTTT